MLLKRLGQDTKGAVAVIVGFGIIMLVGAVGVAVDVGRGQMAQTKLQNSLDAAGLAAGASINSSDLEAEVTKYMNVNFSQGTMAAKITKVTPLLSANGTLLTVTADATMPTTFMKIFGRTTMDLQAETEVTRNSKGMELAMVLDVTGSMCPSGNCVGRLDSLKTASTDLLDILFGPGNATADNLWVGIVPFSMGVNVGPTHTDWLVPGSIAAQDWGTTSWRGCTEARWTTGNDLTEVPPSTERFLPFYAPDSDSSNNWRTPQTSVSTTTLCGPTNSSQCRCTSNGGNHNCGTTTSGNTSTRIYCNGSGSNSTRRCYREVTTTMPTFTYNITSTQSPNLNCPTSEVTRLTNQRATLNTAISNLSAVGGTHIPVGAVWGWHMLSPLWRGTWGGSMDTNNLPLNYNTDLMIKSMILMTDGENTMYDFADGAYGLTSQNHVGMTSTPYTDAKAAARLDVKLGSICTAMKQRGIVIYVVVFDVAEANVKPEIRNCASQTDYYFNAPDSATLRKAFATIGDSLANLRISR